jgi:hypothetical protein
LDGTTNRAPLAEVRQEAERILAQAEARDIALRILGGVAIFLHCGSATHRALQREYRDLDFVGLSSESQAIQALFAELGYEADREFNTLHGQQRLFFWDNSNSRQIDIFLDVLRMSHNLDLRNRLQADRPTVPLADLLLTKLQIYELNQKDATDIITLLHDHPLGYGDDETINLDRIVQVLASDWGFYRTSTLNRDRIQEMLREQGHFSDFDVSNKLDEIVHAVEDAPKTRGWKMRALIGDRKRWYELPDEVRTD